MFLPKDEMLILHLTIHDVYDTKDNKITLEEKPYIKFYWKNIKYKNYLKFFSEEINWFCEFFLPYKIGDYIENLVVQIWATSYIKTKRKIAYNYININQVEQKSKINGKTELIGRRKGLKIIYSLQIICYSLYRFMKNTQKIILDKISIYKMMQIHRKNEKNNYWKEKNNLFDKYLISLFEKKNYEKANTALRLKTIKSPNINTKIKSNFKLKLKSNLKYKLRSKIKLKDKTKEKVSLKKSKINSKTRSNLKTRKKTKKITKKKIKINGNPKNNNSSSGSKKHFLNIGYKIHKLSSKKSIKFFNFKFPILNNENTILRTTTNGSNKNLTYPNFNKAKCIYYLLKRIKKEKLS
ncbi:conserved Plasmodium protein, unknown function [Plasmodium relictum]|uniref:Uncharacterized protein n=1 Tax=Plasmodium relictum TaxID=85471 RepID=A0A1J1HBL0_PLARL|nr:conserved Plasmodium protein, unknown function [Plasmodium relictum]CRH00811.1 conserved Plasmodium protein, unknown function [Plasmodium relictum]